MRRHDSLTTYKISTARGDYAVTMQRLRNTTAGAPRYRALLTLLSGCGICSGSVQEVTTLNYTFVGSYCGDRAEALKVVQHYENTITD